MTIGIETWTWDAFYNSKNIVSGIYIFNKKKSAIRNILILKVLLYGVKVNYVIIVIVVLFETTIKSKKY